MVEPGSESELVDDGGIEAVREWLMESLREALDAGNRSSAGAPDVDGVLLPPAPLASATGVSGAHAGSGGYEDRSAQPTSQEGRMANAPPNDLGAELGQHQRDSARESEEDVIMARLGPVLRPTLQAALVDQALLTVPGVNPQAEHVLRQMASQLDVPALRSALDGGPGQAQLLAYAAIGYAASQGPADGAAEGVASSPVLGGGSRSPLSAQERALVEAHLQAFGDTPEERRFILSEIRRSN